MSETMQSAAPVPQLSPLSLIRALWKHKVLALAVTTLGTGATVGVVSRLPPVYTAVAVVLAESQKIPENFVPATVQTALEAQLDELKEQVLSRDRLWTLIETYDLYDLERQKLAKEEVIERMRRDITITLSRGWSTRGPGAFQVEYEASRPDVAAAVANQIGTFFITENLRQRTNEASETSKFLDEQLTSAEARLRDQESKLKEFKITYNGELPEQEAALLAAVNQSRAELLGVQEGLARAQQNKLILESSLTYAEENQRQRRQLLIDRAGMKENDSTPSLALVPTPPTRLEMAEEELSKLRTRYQDSHPEIQRLMYEVQKLRQEEAARTEVAVRAPADSAPRAATSAMSSPSAATPDDGSENGRIQDLRSQIAVMAQEIKALEDRRHHLLQDADDAQGRIRKLPVREQQLAVITRDYDTSKANYQSLLNKKLAADVATDMERWQKSQKLVMLDPARVPQKPTSPRRRLLDGAGALLSLAIGAGLGILLELRKNVILGEWELPADVLVLGRVPWMNLKNAAGEA